MKKVLVAVFAMSVLSVSAFAADCGCNLDDIACVNNCTLSQVSVLNQKIQTKQQIEVTKAQIIKAQKAFDKGSEDVKVKANKLQIASLEKAQKAQAEEKVAEAKAEAKAKARAQKEEAKKAAKEAKAKAKQAKKEAKEKEKQAKKAAKDAKAKAEKVQSDVKAKKEEVKKTANDSKKALENEKKAWKSLTK